MLSRTLRTATLVVAFIGVMAQAGCSKHADRVTGPAPPPPATQGTTNAPPDTWFAGPDPADASAGWQTDAGPFGGLFLQVPADGWYDFAGVPHTMLSADSLQILPKARVEHRTFFEVYGDRVWLRQEGDTVHMNSVVIFPSGGSDPDSPYSVMVSWLPYGFESPVLTPGPPNGSPIGFRIQLELKDILGRVDRPSEGFTYPVFDPRTAPNAPIINGYQGLREAGRAYTVARAVDGDGAEDRRIAGPPDDAVGIADRVDAGGGSPADRALRSKILTFYVDHPPRLLQGNPSFRPTPHQVFTSRTIGVDLLAVDDDPFDALAHFESNSHVGGPIDAPILRRRLAILGKLASDPSRDTCYVVAGDFNNAPVAITIPDWIANGPITLLIRLCDCYECDVLPGPSTCPAFAGEELRPTFGACVDTSIPCQLDVPGPAAMLAR